MVWIPEVISIMVNRSLTPTGVEHVLHGSFRLLAMLVNRSLTPTGVEHNKQRPETIKPSFVNRSLTPTGVEHERMSESNPAYRSEPIFDADRR